MAYVVYIFPASGKYVASTVPGGLTLDQLGERRVPFTDTETIPLSRIAHRYFDGTAGSKQDAVRMTIEEGFGVSKQQSSQPDDGIGNIRQAVEAMLGMPMPGGGR